VVELRDVPVTLRVVVVGVDHDLAGQRLGRHGAVGLERDAHHHDVPGLRGFGRGCRAGSWPEFGGEVAESLRPPGVAEYDVVTGVDGQAGDGASDVAAADESDG